MPWRTVADGAPRGRTRTRRRAVRRVAPPPLYAGCALFLDIDGTLLDLAPTPDRVRVDADVATLLPALWLRLGGAVALITGRAMADAERLFPGVALPIAGQHGLERRAADGSIGRHERSAPGFARLRRELERFAARHEGLLLEDKGATLAMHYRQAPGLASHVHRTLRAQLAAATGVAAWHLQPGKGILEITPDGHDKGTAIREYMMEQPFRGRVPVFVGDDRTDEYGFGAVTHLGGWAIKVGAGGTCARFRLADVAAVRRWLTAALVPTESPASETA